MTRLADKVAVVTGGGSGIGRAGAEAATVDVASSEPVQPLMAGVVERHGRIDVLFYCAADVPFINREDGRATEPMRNTT